MTRQNFCEQNVAGIVRKGLGIPLPFYVMYSLSKHILQKVSTISFIKTFIEERQPVASNRWGNECAEQILIHS